MNFVRTAPLRSRSAWALAFAGSYRAATVTERSSDELGLAQPE